MTKLLCLKILKRGGGSNALKFIHHIWSGDNISLLCVLAYKPILLHIKLTPKLNYVQNIPSSKVKLTLKKIRNLALKKLCLYASINSSIVFLCFREKLWWGEIYIQELESWCGQREIAIHCRGGVFCPTSCYLFAHRLIST